MTAPSRQGLSVNGTVTLPVMSPLLIRVVAGIVILGLWELGTRAFAAPFVARPLNIIAAVPKVFADPAYWAASLSTLSAVLLGLAIALVLGTLIGLVLGRIRGADRMLSFWVSSFYAMPMIAALPLLTVWFGFDEGARLATIVFAALFSVVINVADGARSTPAEYLEVGRSYRAKARHIWFDITLLSAVPYLIAGRPARRRAHVDRRDPGGDLYRGRRARLLHPRQCARAAPERGLRRRVDALLLRSRLRGAHGLCAATMVPPGIAAMMRPPFLRAIPHIRA